MAYQIPDTALWGFWYISEQNNDYCPCGVYSSRGDSEVSPMEKKQKALKQSWGVESAGARRQQGVEDIREQ